MNMDIPDRPESIFWHSPYDRAVVYSGNMYDADEVDRKYGIDCRANDLSRCRDWDEFVKKMNYCMLKQFTALQPGGYMFSLVGDIKKNGQLYSMISDIVKPGRTINILIKLQHHCTSDSFTYSNNNFIPIVHEYVLISQKEKGFIIPLSMIDIFVEGHDPLQPAHFSERLTAFPSIPSASPRPPSIFSPQRMRSSGMMQAEMNPSSVPILIEASTVPVQENPVPSDDKALTPSYEMSTPPERSPEDR